MIDENENVDWAKIQTAIQANSPAGLTREERVLYFDIRYSCVKSIVDKQLAEGTIKAEDVLEEHAAALDRGDVQTIPENILRPPGLCGIFRDWIIESSGMYQPKFATAAALTFMGALIGRGVKDYTGQRTGIYTLAVGNSSAGKNDPIRAIQLAARELQRLKLIQGEITSDSALEVLLLAFPVRLLALDEVGHYLANIKNAGQNNGHLRTVMPMLTKAWSAAGGQLQGKTRAENNNARWTPGKTILDPCVSVYGTTVPNVLFESLNSTDLGDGSISRFLCFISESRPVRVMKPEMTMPQELKSRIIDALTKLGLKPHCLATKTDDKFDDVPTPRQIPETKEAGDVFNKFEELKTRKLIEADNGDTPCGLYGKIVENARRVALTVAAFRNPDNPVVEELDAKFAVNLLTALTEEFVQRVRAEVASTKSERDKKTVLLVIRQAGQNGIDGATLTRKTQSLRPLERREALEDLIEAEIITREQIKGKTKPGYLYKIANGSEKK